MRFTKAQNPYDVQSGQVWADRDASRTAEFEVKRLFAENGSVFAEVYRKKTKKTAHIRLDRFNKYLKRRS